MLKFKLKEEYALHQVHLDSVALSHALSVVDTEALCLSRKMSGPEWRIFF